MDIITLILLDHVGCTDPTVCGIGKIDTYLIPVLDLAFMPAETVKHDSDDQFVSLDLSRETTLVNTCFALVAV